MAVNPTPLNIWSDSNRTNGFTLVIDGATADNLLCATFNGWVNEVEEPSAAGWTMAVRSQESSNSNTFIFYRIATGTTADNFVAVFPFGIERWAICAGEYSGVDSTNPFSSAFAADSNGALVTTTTTPSLTATEGQLLIAGMGCRDSSDYDTLNALRAIVPTDGFADEFQAGLQVSTRPASLQCSRVAAAGAITTTMAGDGAQTGTWAQSVIAAFNLASSGPGPVQVDPDDLSQDQLIGQPSLSQGYVNSTDSISQDQGIDSVSLTQAQAIVPDSLEQATLLAGVLIISEDIVNPEYVLQGSQTIEQVLLTQHFSEIQVNNLQQDQSVSSPSLFDGLLSVSSLSQGQSLSIVLLDGAIPSGLDGTILSYPELLGSVVNYSYSVGSVSSKAALNGNVLSK